MEKDVLEKNFWKENFLMKQGYSDPKRCGVKGEENKIRRGRYSYTMGFSWERRRGVLISRE